MKPSNTATLLPLGHAYRARCAGLSTSVDQAVAAGTALDGEAQLGVGVAHTDSAKQALSAAVKASERWEELNRSLTLMLREKGLGNCGVREREVEE